MKIITNKSFARIYGVILVIFTVIVSLTLLLPNLATPQSEKFKVTLEIDDSLMTHKTLYITIQNLQDTTDNLDIKTILNSTNFAISGVSNVKWYVQQKEFYTETRYNTVCNPWEETLSNGTVNIYPNCTNNPYTVELERQVWKEKSLTSKVENGQKGELKHQWEQITIQKAGQEKDTVKFKLEFDHPIVETKSGWGSKGVLWLDLNGKEYVDLSSSSWWNTTWKARKAIYWNNSEAKRHELTALAFWFNNSDIVDCSEELRLVNGTAGTADITSTDMYVLIDQAPNCYIAIRTNVSASANETIGYIYYKNNTPVYAPIDKTNWLYDDFDNTTKLDNSQWDIVDQKVFSSCIAEISATWATHYINSNQLNSTVTGDIGQNTRLFKTAKSWLGNDTISTTFRKINQSTTTDVWNSPLWGIWNATNMNLQHSAYERKATQRAGWAVCNTTISTGTFVISQTYDGLAGINFTWNGQTKWAYSWMNDTLGTANNTATNFNNNQLYNFFLAVRTDASAIVNAWYDDVCVNCRIYTRNYGDERLDTVTLGLEESLVVDTTPPTWSNPKTNATNETKTGQTIYFNITWFDNVSLSFYIFTWNGTGGWVNTTGALTGTEANISINKTIEVTRGKVIGYRWYANDTSNNWGVTPEWSFTVANTVPIHTNPILNSTYGTNFTTENLTCYNQSTYDADKDSVTNIYNWYKDNTTLAVLNMPFESNTRDYSNYGNDGTIYGTTWETGKKTGKVGNAFEFDGSNDYIDFGNDESLNITGSEITLEAWINGRAFTTSPIYRGIVGKYNPADGWWWLGVHSQLTQIYVAISTSDGAKQDVITTDVTGWNHLVMVYNGSALKTYKNGVEVGSVSHTGTLIPLTENVIVGAARSTERYFNGTIDEVRIYPYALTPEQIKAHYNLEYNKIVSQEIKTAGEIYKCEITPNDGFDDGITKASNNVTIVWNITFNITSGEDGSQLNNVNIYCNNSWSVTGISSPYVHGFLPGTYKCIFSHQLVGYFNKTTIFTADRDKTVDIIMSLTGFLSVEEHQMLEAIYKCIINGDCTLYNMLQNVTETTSKIWNQFKRTDQSVVTFENVTSYVVSNTSNLTIEYNVNVPTKEGYGIVDGIQGYDDFLPIKISYWFLDLTNTTCYNQGSKPIGVEGPYCQPLTITTIGQIQTTINFTVDLRPDLPVGNYTIVRNIEIDPNNMWIDYGHEIIGKVEIVFSGKELITLKHISAATKEVSEVIGKAIPGTRATTGLSGLLTATNISLAISLVTLVLVGYLIITRNRRKAFFL